jgi:tetratricopeptide (TPR) repeat protein
LGNALFSCVTYIVQTVWPDNLAVFYPYRFDIPTWQTAGAGALLLFITLLVFRTARRFPYFTTGWLWYLGMLVPVIGLVQVGGQSHADRYTYLPQIGLSLVIVWAIKDWTASWRWRRQVLGVTAFSVVAILMVCSLKQTAYWRNDKSLWTHALACTSGNYTAHNDLGYVLAAQGRTNEAIEHYQKALEIYPDYAEADNNLGTVFLNQGRLDEAAEYYHRALEANPSFAEAHNNLGILLAKQGRITEAIEHYQKAIELNPNRAEMYNNLGNLLATRGRPAEAIGQFQKALEMEPDNAKAHYNLANIFTAQGRWDEAIEHYQRALKQMPDSIHAHYQLGLALQYRGKFAAAIAQFQKVLELDPRHVTAQNNLAWLLATCPEASLRDGKKAVELAQQAVQLSGGKSPEILDTLAAAYAEAGRFPEAIETAQRVLDLSAAQNNKPLAKVIQNQLKLFETNSPYHEKP